MKSLVDTLLRLPLEPDEIVRRLEAAESSLQSPTDENYTTCWIVVADRFHRYGVDHPPTLDLARSLIADGVDHEMMKSLEMSAANLRKRSRSLALLAERLNGPNPKAYRRAILTRPQPLLLEIGDVYAYPIDSKGRVVNPYMGEQTRNHFEPAAFMASVVGDRGHALGYLAYYGFSQLSEVWSDLPNIDECLEVATTTPVFGTLSKSHFHRMQMVKLGQVNIDYSIELTAINNPERVAIDDVSISNWLGDKPANVRRSNHGPTLNDLLTRR